MALFIVEPDVWLLEAEHYVHNRIVAKTHLRTVFPQQKVKRRQRVTYFIEDHTSDSWMPDKLISQLTLASSLALHSADSLYKRGWESTLFAANNGKS